MRKPAFPPCDYGERRVFALFQCFLLMLRCFCGVLVVVFVFVAQALIFGQIWCIVEGWLPLLYGSLYKPICFLVLFLGVIEAACSHEILVVGNYPCKVLHGALAEYLLVLEFISRDVVQIG